MRFERDYSILYGNSYQMFLIKINFESQLVKFTECESRPCVDFLDFFFRNSYHVRNVCSDFGSGIMMHQES